MSIREVIPNMWERLTYRMKGSHRMSLLSNAVESRAEGKREFNCQDERLRRKASQEAAFEKMGVRSTKQPTA